MLERPVKPDTADLEKELGGLEEQLEKAASILPAPSSADQVRLMTAQEDRTNRTFAVRLISWVYAGGLAILAAVILMEAWYGDRTKAVSYVMDALKVLILPILTLVLGHYIGRNSR